MGGLVADGTAEEEAGRRKVNDLTFIVLSIYNISPLTPTPTPPASSNASYIS